MIKAKTGCDTYMQQEVCSNAGWVTDLTFHQSLKINNHFYSTHSDKMSISPTQQFANINLGKRMPVVGLLKAGWLLSWKSEKSQCDDKN